MKCDCLASLDLASSDALDAPPEPGRENGDG